MRRLPLLLGSLLMVAGCSASAPAGSTPDAAPPSSPAPQTPVPGADNTDQVGIIGDSLTAEMIDYGLLQPALTGLGWDPADIRLDGQWGRPIDHGGMVPTSDVIEQWRADGFDPRVWLIALGTNNVSGDPEDWQQDIRGVLDQINSGPAGGYTISWTTLGFADGGYYDEQAFEDTLREIAEDYPNLQVADYDAFLDDYRDDPRWLSWWSDPVHHSEAGYADLRTPFYVQVLTPEAPG